MAGTWDSSGQFQMSGPYYVCEVLYIKPQALHYSVQRTLLFEGCPLSRVTIPSHVYWWPRVMTVKGRGHKCLAEWSLCTSCIVLSSVRFYQPIGSLHASGVGVKAQPSS